MTYETQITLDLSGHQHSPPVTAMQGDKDSRVIIARLTSGGVQYTIPEGTTARVSLIKQNGKCVMQDAEITENFVKITLTEQMLLDAGSARAEVILFNGDAVLSSAVFELAVLPAAYDRNSIEESQDYQTFVDALSQLQDIKEQGDYAKTQGGYAETQGNYAKEWGSEAERIEKLCENAYTLAVKMAESANDAANRANKAAEACESTGVPQLTEALSSHTSNKTNPHGVTAAQIGAAALDANGTLDIDVLPVGFTTIWWSDTLPSDKWAFGNTSIPSSCTKARQIWGTTTPDITGRVVVDKGTDTHFNTLKQTGGEITKGLRALIGTIGNDINTLAYQTATPVDGKSYNMGISGTAIPSFSGKGVNYSVPVVDVNGNNLALLQPYIVARYIFKIK